MVSTKPESLPVIKILKLIVVSGQIRHTYISHLLSDPASAVLVFPDFLEFLNELNSKLFLP